VASKPTGSRCGATFKRSTSGSNFDTLIAFWSGNLRNLTEVDAWITFWVPGGENAHIWREWNQHVLYCRRRRWWRGLQGANVGNEFLMSELFLFGTQYDEDRIMGAGVLLAATVQAALQTRDLGQG